MTVTEHVYRSALETKVLALLKQGPLTAAELVREIGCSYNVLYPITWNLRQSGEISTAPMRRGLGSGSGRGGYIYSLVGR